ncbi:DUF6622 family protein [Pseudochrobactrum kiredjianiae]|uniref:DUF6622 family protein n=1 Tax=Pseudochrobactrum kiredjianiae TaxID=386305 RepID=A0ABW3V564_9HYPH|nr:DUF6622 family protein [Pseudochrobactrum kiredjianiae]MDM7850802.1 hypothetical protein [Pseudochrobactrum kiredjianiae]
MQLTEIVTHTPWWVWVLLVYLVYRGICLLSMTNISPKRMLLMPSIFLIWGIYGMFNKLYMPWSALFIFAIALIVGLLLGKTVMAMQPPAIFDSTTGMVQRPGSVVPIIVILLNFGCLYSLNVYAGYHPDSLRELNFTAIYSVTSGLADGFFWGMSLTILMKAFTGSVMRPAG